MIEPDNKIELKVLEVSQIDSKGNQYILLLRERFGNRQLPLPISKREAEDILAAMNTEPLHHAPWTQTLKDIVNALDVIVQEVVFSEVKYGNYMADVVLLQNGQETTIHTYAVQATILALSSRSSFYISKELMERQYVQPRGKGLVSVPLNTLSVTMLQDALDLAIKEENYELASHLRDEIKRRS